MAIGTNVSKANIYSALRTPDGISIGKALIYAVVYPCVVYTGVDVAKANIYAVLAAGYGSFWPVILRMLDQQRRRV